MAAVLDLKVNRDLLDSKFDGYKLFLDRLPVYVRDFEKGLDIAKSTEDQWSFQHARLFSLHNHLALDPWCPTAVYFVDGEWAVRRLDISIETQLDSGVAVYHIPAAADRRLVSGRYNVTLTFVSPDLALLADGAGTLFLLSTENRGKQPQAWKAVFTDSLLGEGRQFQVVDGVCHSEGESKRVECLLTGVEEVDGEAKEKHKSPFLSILHWISLSTVDQTTWTVERTRRLEGAKPFEYAALERGSGSAVYLATPRPFQLTMDSVKPVQNTSDEDWEVIGNRDEPQYTWSQTDEEVTVQFTLAEGVGKADIYWSLSPDHLDLGVKNGQPLLKGELGGKADVEASTWTIAGRRLELTLGKTSEMSWETVVQGDNHGEMVISAERVAEIHQRLAHLTSDVMNPDPEDGDKPFNAQELEDCDAYPDDSSVLQRIDGETHKMTHKVNVGSNQWLFNVAVDPERPPAVCLRYDVDGLLWQPGSPAKPGESPWQHIGTFNALGYVQASKQQKKFSASSPDGSFAIICDCVRHCYIYRQDSPISSPLRNRKTGQQVNSVAKQQVVALEATEEIRGIAVTNEKVVIATEHKIHVVRVKE